MKKLAALLIAAVTALGPLSPAASCAVPAMDFSDVQTADTPDLSDHYSTPDTPDTPAEADSEDAEDSADIPATEDNEGSETADVPDDREDHPETEDDPPGKNEDTFDTPEAADTSDIPDAADTPDTADLPDTPDTSDSDTDSDVKTDTDTQTDSDGIGGTDTDEKPPEPPKDTTPQGDVNGDGVITTDDALLVLRFSIGYRSIGGSHMKYADFNLDGAVDSFDAVAILRLTVDVTSGSSSGGSSVADTRDDSGFARGIDVSQWQGSINFNKVKQSGIDFVMIRAGFGRDRSQKDPYFEQNYARARAAGLKVGVYWYSYATSAADARQEARTCMWAISGKKFDYPIYFDLEENWQIRKGTSFCSSIVTAFCSELEVNGYYAGFYMSTSQAKSVLTAEVQSRYAYWAAEWNDHVNYYNQYGMWQYSDRGIVGGINGYVDLDYCYIDYPSVMKEFHLNGY